jgi:hypothetical protein
MGRDRTLGPGYAVMLLASMALAAVYFTTEFVDYHESYFHTLIGKVDQAISEAYGQATPTEKER